MQNIFNKLADSKDKHYFVKGTDCYKKSEYRDAIGFFQKGLKYLKGKNALDPTLADVYNNMGISFFNLSDHENALESFKKAVELDPKDTLAYYNMGHTLIKLGKNIDAINAFQESLKIDPKNTEAYKNIASSFISLRRHK